MRIDVLKLRFALEVAFLIVVSLIIGFTVEYDGLGQARDRLGLTPCFEFHHTLANVFPYWRVIYWAGPVISILVVAALWFRCSQEEAERKWESIGRIWIVAVVCAWFLPVPSFVPMLSKLAFGWLWGVREVVKGLSSVDNRRRLAFGLILWVGLWALAGNMAVMKQRKAEAWWEKHFIDYVGNRHLEKSAKEKFFSLWLSDPGKASFLMAQRLEEIDGGVYSGGGQLCLDGDTTEGEVRLARELRMVEAVPFMLNVWWRFDDSSLAAKKVRRDVQDILGHDFETPDEARAWLDENGGVEGVVQKLYGDLRAPEARQDRLEMIKRYRRVGEAISTLRWIRIWRDDPAEWCADLVREGTSQDVKSPEDAIDWMIENTEFGYLADDLEIIDYL